MLSKLFRFFTGLWKKSPPSLPKGQIALKYALDHTMISIEAFKVIKRLKQFNYQAYLVGGSIRDILLGYRPKDFDIVTNATPAQITQIFKNSRIIGKRFLLVHIRFRSEIIEVATFRQSSSGVKARNGLLVHDNQFGSIEDDVFRRDFGMNALYYDPVEEIILDYVGGLNDIKDKMVRLIGNHEIRYVEDPVRMIRAVRYATKLNLTLESSSKIFIEKKASLLLYVPKARLYEEFLKCFMHVNAEKTFIMMKALNLCQYLIPKSLLTPSCSKHIHKSLKWLGRQSYQKEHGVLLVFLCFLISGIKDSQSNKNSARAKELLNDFYNLITIPRAIEHHLAKLLIGTHKSDSRKAHDFPTIPNHNTFKGLFKNLSDSMNF